MSDESNSSIEVTEEGLFHQQNGNQSDYTNENGILNTIMNGIEVEPADPYLKIVEEPQSRGFRFRYKCEGGSHGGLQGVKSERGKKTFPTVQLFNYDGDARIVVSLVTDESRPKAHAHDLVGKNCQDGVCVVELKKGKHMTATFPNLGIQHVTRKMLVSVLESRIADSLKLQKAMKAGTISTRHNQTLTDIEKQNIHKQAEEQAKSMSLNVARLCFQAYLLDANGQFSRLLPSVISLPIYDCKSPGAAALKICRMDKQAGCCTGGDEVFLLCDKVQKDDIQVVFYEEDEEGAVKWENFGNFGPADVHRQYAIVFKTPAYFNQNIDKQVTVRIKLKRRSDSEESEYKIFTYYPQHHDREEIGKKRKKPMWGNQFGGGSSAGGGGGYNFSGGSVGTNFNFGTGSSFSGGSYDEHGAATHGNNMTNTMQPMVSKAAMSEYLQTSTLVSTNLSSNVEEDSAPDFDTTVQDLPLKSTACAKTTNRSLTIESSSRIEDVKIREYNMALQIAERTAAAMHAYAMSGDVRRLLAMQRHLVAVEDNEGDMALHLAVIHCQPEACRNLLSVILTLADRSIINKYNHLSQTPLHLAVLTNQPYLVDLLMRSGANPLLQDRAGNTACHLAAEDGSEHCLHALLRFDRQTSTQQCPYPDLEILNYDGLAPIHLAVLSDSLDTLKYLTRAECDVNIADGKSGSTALHWAVESENLAAAGHLILEAGANVNQERYDGNTPLHIAVSEGNLNMAALLMAAGADPDIENSEALSFVDSDDDMDEDGEDREMQGHTPYDLTTDIKIIKILNGEPYLSVTESGFDSSMSRNTNKAGDIDKIDYMARISIAKLLDTPSQDWRTLAENVGLGCLVGAFKTQRSPTLSLLDNFEAIDGTISELREVLIDMKRHDVIQQIDDYFADKQKNLKSMDLNKSETSSTVDTKLPKSSGQSVKNNSLDDLESGIESMQIDQSVTVK